MRVLLCLIVLLLTVPACRSQVPDVAADWEREAAFSALPTPSELATLRQVAAAPPVKTTSDVLIMLGQEYSSDLPFFATSVNWGERSCTMNGGLEQLPYCFFEPETGTEAGDLIQGVHADIVWADDPPAAPFGLYFGLADWEHDCWYWLGPYDDAEDWLVVPDGGLPVNANGLNLVAMINYSAVDVTLNQLRLMYAGPDELPDCWLYYTHFDDNPNQTSISRTVIGGEPEVLFTGDDFHAYERPHIGIILGSTRLGYAYNDGTYWKIWRSNLDGSAANRLVSREYDVRPAGWAPDGSAFLYLEGDDPGEYELWARDTVNEVNGRLANAGTVIYDAIWDQAHDAHAFSALLVQEGDAPGSPVILGQIWTNAVDADTTPYALLFDESLPFCDPYCYEVPGIHVPLRGYVCSQCVNLQIQYTTMGQEDTDELLLAPLDIEYRYPTVSPDGHYLAYLSCLPGEERGTLMIKSFTNPDPDDFYTYMQIENVRGRVAWHDPTP